jgi:hypothetical protein
MAPYYVLDFLAVHDGARQQDYGLEVAGMDFLPNVVVSDVHVLHSGIVHQFREVITEFANKKRVRKILCELRLLFLFHFQKLPSLDLRESGPALDKGQSRVWFVPVICFWHTGSRPNRITAMNLNSARAVTPVEQR